MVPPPCTHANDAVIQKAIMFFFSVQIISSFLKKIIIMNTNIFLNLSYKLLYRFFFVSFFLIHQKTNISESSFILFIILFIESFIIFARFHKQDWIGKEMAWHFYFFLVFVKPKCKFIYFSSSYFFFRL